MEYLITHCRYVLFLFFYSTQTHNLFQQHLFPMFFGTCTLSPGSLFWVVILIDRVLQSAGKTSKNVLFPLCRRPISVNSFQFKSQYIVQPQDLQKTFHVTLITGPEHHFIHVSLSVNATKTCRALLFKLWVPGKCLRKGLVHTKLTYVYSFYI